MTYIPLPASGMQSQSRANRREMKQPAKEAGLLRPGADIKVSRVRPPSLSHPPVPLLMETKSQIAPMQYEDTMKRMSFCYAKDGALAWVTFYRSSSGSSAVLSKIYAGPETAEILSRQALNFATMAKDVGEREKSSFPGNLRARWERYFGPPAALVSSSWEARAQRQVSKVSREMNTGSTKLPIHQSGGNLDHMQDGEDHVEFLTKHEERGARTRSKPIREKLTLPSQRSRPSPVKPPRPLEKQKLADRMVADEGPVLARDQGNQVPTTSAMTTIEADQWLFRLFYTNEMLSDHDLQTVALTIKLHEGFSIPPSITLLKECQEHRNRTGQAGCDHANYQRWLSFMRTQRQLMEEGLVVLGSRPVQSERGGPDLPVVHSSWASAAVDVETYGTLGPPDVCQAVEPKPRKSPNKVEIHHSSTNLLPSPISVQQPIGDAPSLKESIRQLNRSLRKKKTYKGRLIRDVRTLDRTIKKSERPMTDSLKKQRACKLKDLRVVNGQCNTLLHKRLRVAKERRKGTSRKQARDAGHR
ncbi:hypothetical protein P154DRAFT_538777 [Amniculicola lignicola CBS 123094]|uniref:Uncharacterized protein n=1 Tax=Amniculicola lignicola CBS 123094 TaxID=1392246 RepID=A0A6A5W5M2_9PLEO|nr:hypothetical protein P154DRAFT_538777 [Amniculicola lignicola CBS 123094]